MATTNILKKKQQQLQADQDLLADKWTEVLAAEEYKLERPSKSYPRHRLLPRLEEEAYDTADWPPCGRDREAFQPKAQPPPQRHSNKKAWGDTPDPRDILDDKAKHSRSIYGCAPERVTTTVTPDRVKANPAGPNTAGRTHTSCVTIYPNTEAPHTPYDSQTK